MISLCSFLLVVSANDNNVFMRNISIEAKAATGQLRCQRQ